MNLNFSWNPDKAKSNILKHKVSFETATSIFKDPNSLSIFDESYSSSEERWITMGLASTGSIIDLIHTYNIIDDKNINVRIISARKATKKEKNQYMEHK